MVEVDICENIKPNRLKLAQKQSYIGPFGESIMILKSSQNQTKTVLVLFFEVEDNMIWPAKYLLDVFKVEKLRLLQAYNTPFSHISAK